MIIRRDIDVPLYRQVYNHICNQIFQGVLKESEPLLSSRKLAEQIGVSRNVVLEAYDQLLAEGYIEARQGSYTRVAQGIKKVAKKIEKPDISPVLKNRTVELVDFKTGVPDVSSFPRAVWGRYLKKACDEIPDVQLGYIEPEGVYELRKTICDYLFRTRSIQVIPEDIVITSGATQGLALVSRMLFEEGAEAIVEDPSSLGTQKVIQYAGYELVPTKTDEEGIQIANLQISENTKLIYTTPSHQFPMGGILSIQRRLALLELVEDEQCYIIEDDYDGEFRYDGHPITPMRAIDDSKVIYLGSFSKVLTPALRLGYVVLPKPLVKRFKSLKLFDDVHTGTIEQWALNGFITEGHFERHLFKMQKRYKQKRNRLVCSLNRYFGDQIEIYGNQSGLHLVVRLKNWIVDEELWEDLGDDKVKIHAVEKLTLVKGCYTSYFLLGYGHLSIEEIEKGVMLLYQRVYPEKTLDR